MPWAPAEREDSIQVIDWIVQQNWSNGQVCQLATIPIQSCNLSGTTLLFGAAFVHNFLPRNTPIYCAKPCVLLQQVLLSGVSYEATAALFTVSEHHPAVKGCLAQYPFW